MGAQCAPLFALKEWFNWMICTLATATGCIHEEQFKSLEVEVSFKNEATWSVPRGSLQMTSKNLMVVQ